MLVLMYKEGISAATFDYRALYQPSGTTALSGISFDNQDNMYVAGTTVGLTTGTDAIALKFDSAGTLVWENSYGNNSSREVGDCKYHNGYLYMVGYAYDGQYIANLSALNDATGAMQFNKGVSGSSVTKFEGVSIPSVNAIYAAGVASMQSNTIRGRIIVKFDDSGNRIWQRYVGGTASDYNSGERSGIAVSPDGTRIMVVGLETSTQGGETNTLFAQLNSGGGYINVGRIDAESADPETGRAAAYDSSNNAYILSTHRTNGENRSLLVKLTTSNVVEWLREFGTTGTGDTGYKLAVDSSDNIYVVGTTTEDTIDGAPWATYVRKFDTSGNQVWSRIIGSSARGIITGTPNIEIGPNDDIYIVGANYGGFPANAGMIVRLGQTLTSDTTTGDYTYRSSSLTSSATGNVVSLNPPGLSVNTPSDSILTYVSNFSASILDPNLTDDATNW